MKRLAFFFVSVLFCLSTVYAQETVELAQLFLGIQVVGSSEVVDHTIDAAGIVWEKSGSTYSISEDEDIYTSTMYSTGNFNQSNYATSASFNWVWLNQGEGGAPWGLGLYKITNSKVSGKYFYLDTRDNEYVETTINADVWFVYKTNTGKYHCIVKCNDVPIENGSLVRVSDILGFTSKTDKLQNFWSNALVVVPSIAQPYTPRIIWGPIPNFSATGYKVYWRYGGSGNFSLLAIVGASTFEYTHEGLAIGNGVIAEYKVQAYNGSSTSDFSNTVSIGTSGFFKQNLGVEENSLTYRLNQNYPNPFNPSTVISYSIAENSFVSLKVSDVLGNEIADLVSEVKEQGNYNVSFDASNLSSGIYFYTLKASGNSLTKKMLLAK